MAMFTDEEDALIDFLEEEYGCHTILLYGSRAMGIARPGSDWDVLGLYPGHERKWCHIDLPGVGEVNAYIYPESWVVYDAKRPSPLHQWMAFFVHLRVAKVLVQKGTLGDEIIADATTLHRNGPPALPPGFVEQLRYQFGNYWLETHFTGYEGIDPLQQQFARHRLLHHCLDTYFQVRQLWTLSEKDSFAYIKAHDPQTYAAFAAALKPDATKAEFLQLIDRLLTPST